MTIAGVINIHKYRIVFSSIFETIGADTIETGRFLFQAENFVLRKRQWFFDIDLFLNS